MQEKGFLKANASKRVLPVPFGIVMGGYGDRPEGNKGTHDDLYTKSLVLSNGKETIVIITNDLLEVDNEITSFVRKGIQKYYQIPDKNIMLSASHTHGGPDVTSKTFKLEGEDRTNLHQLKKTIVRIILDNALISLQNLFPAAIGFGNTICENVTFNRINPHYPTDPLVNVINIIHLSTNEPIATLINFSCHPTILSSKNSFISADYPGFLQKRIEKHFQNDAIVMFTNGASGNQSTRFSRNAQNFEEVERLGEMLAEKTLEAIQFITKYNEFIEIKSNRKIISLPYKDFPSKEEAMRTLEEATAMKEKHSQQDFPKSEQRKAFTRWQGANLTLYMMDHINEFQQLSEVQLLKLGDKLLVGLPVELFVELGLQIKEQTKSNETIIVGYANNLLGYIYANDKKYSDCYEALASPFSNEAGELIVKQVLDMEEELK